MALRIKTKWHESKRVRSRGPKTVADRASVIGFYFWKIARATFEHMEKEGFRFATDLQVIGVLTELIAFFVQITDRLVYGQMTEDERRELITEVVKHLAKTMQNNLMDVIGDGKYEKPFVTTMNERFQDYAEFEFGDHGPGYGFNRYLADKISEVMAATDNKWVTEHVMEIEVPEALKNVKKVVRETLGVKVPA